MFHNLITVSETPAWYSHKYLVRLVARDDAASYYLSCWRLISERIRPDYEQLEDHQALNWKCEIENGQAEQWLNLLRYQSVIIAPAPLNEETRDGSFYSFRWECGSHGLRHLELHWPNDIPVGWETVGLVTMEMLEIAELHAPDEAKRKKDLKRR